MSPEDDCWLTMRAIGMTTRGSPQTINTQSEAGYEHCIEILDRIQDTKGKRSWDLRRSSENGNQRDHISRLLHEISVEQVETSIVKSSDREMNSDLSDIYHINACQYH